MAPNPDITRVSSVGEDGIISDKEQLKIAADGTVVDHGLHRALKQRHLQMIALGGVIG
jgi:amino acid permease